MRFDKIFVEHVLLTNGIVSLRLGWARRRPCPAVRCFNCFRRARAYHWIFRGAMNSKKTEAGRQDLVAYIPLVRNGALYEQKIPCGGLIAQYRLGVHSQPSVEHCTLGFRP